MVEKFRERVIGCLVGGAVGDALGAPYEFARWPSIQAAVGPAGIDSMLPPGHFTDDTQMTLFTCEGLLNAGIQMEKWGTCHPPSTLHLSYLRWLTTQGVPWEEVARYSEHLGGWLVHERRLNRREAPGTTCLNALQSGQLGRVNAPINDSKGCGGIMRAAPAGFLVPGIPVGASPPEAYILGCEVAAVTHGHPDGLHAAGVLAALVCATFAGSTVLDAATCAAELTTPQIAEVIARALEVGALGPPSPDVIDTELGEGWVADEALGIALACAVGAESLEQGVLAAVNHSGDTDSTGAICGNILGALHGAEAIPASWTSALDSIDIVMAVAEDCVAWLSIQADVADPDPIELERLVKRYASL